MYFHVFFVHFLHESQIIGLFKVSSISFEAQQVLNFLIIQRFQPAKFLKKFLGFWHFEPRFSYK